LDRKALDRLRKLLAGGESQPESAEVLSMSARTIGRTFGNIKANDHGATFQNARREGRREADALFSKRSIAAPVFATPVSLIP
jgi:hypothetical protein